MNLYNTKYFKWFYNRDYKFEEEQAKKNGLGINDALLFESHVMRGVKLNFFGLHIIIILIAIGLIKLL